MKTAYQAIREHQPGLVFLDIGMPKGSGFDLLKMFSPVDFSVIFVTAYTDYAVQAFRYSAEDYLLKPVKVEELIEAVARAKSCSTPESRQIGLLLENLCTTDEKSKKLSIANAKGFDIVKTSDIILIEADVNLNRNFYFNGDESYTKFFCSDFKNSFNSQIEDQRS